MTPEAQELALALDPVFYGKRGDVVVEAIVTHLLFIACASADHSITIEEAKRQIIKYLTDNPAAYFTFSPDLRKPANDR